MAKLTYLELTNRVLRRINITEITDVTTALGQALIVTNLINEVQTELYNITNWYTLYNARTFVTVASMDTYALATDFGRCINLMDVTNNNVLREDVIKAFDIDDPNANNIGQPLNFAIQGLYYRLYPIPSGVYTIRDRYWKIPTTLSTNSQVYDFPLETENCIIHMTLLKTFEYMNKFESADRARISLFGNESTNFRGLLYNAIVANNKITDKMQVMSVDNSQYMDGIAMPRFPSGYGARYF